MTSLHTLADAIERYEVTGPYDIARDREREMNERVACAAGVPCTVEVGHEALGNYRRVPARLPAYTASLDAAASLVPKGWDWCAETFGEDGSHGKVWKHGWHDDTVIHGNAATPALALCAASLRALASMEAEWGKEADRG